MPETATSTSTRDADVNGWTGGMPAWMRFVAFVGVPSAILCWYMYSISPRVEALEKAVTAMTVAMSTLSAQQRDAFFVAQRICINTARTDGDKVACVSLTTPR